MRHRPNSVATAVRSVPGGVSFQATRRVPAAWIGVAAGLAGGGLLLTILGLRSVPRGTAYAALGAVAGGFLFASLLIFLSSFEFDLLGGSIPRPPDAFDEAAKVLLVAGLLLVPAGEVVRWLTARIGRSARSIA
jgi:hypothetical protein